MSNFGALWDVAKPVFPATGNPQGVLALPVGTIAVSPCGNIYVKKGGGSTAFGWYLFGSPQSRNWQPLFVSAAAQMGVNANSQLLVAGPSTIINFLAQQSGSANTFSSKRGYMGGYTSGVAGNSFLYRPQNNVDYMPSQRIDGSLVNDFQEFDCYWDIATTPRSSSLTGSTDLTTNAMRIWAGGVFGAAAVQAVGGTVSSDTLATEWPTALAVTNGLFGWAFRWSSAVDGANWRLVTTNCAAGAYTQTVTDMLVPIAANTLYRLRVRFIVVAGAVTCLASINDGAEISVTANVGPTTLVPNQTMPFQPLASVRQINATTKSLAVAECSLNYGIGVGLSGC